MKQYIVLKLIGLAIKNRLIPAKRCAEKVFLKGNRWNLTKKIISP